MNKAIIFDTNAYRVFTYNKSIEECTEQINIIKSKEALVGNISLLSPVVLIELAAHLADLNHSSYQNCKASFITCYNHCKAENSEDFRMIPDGDSHLAKILFDYIDQKMLDKWIAYGQLALKMSKDFSEESINTYRNYFVDMADYVSHIEAQFVADMHRFVVKDINPKATDWNPLKDDKQRRKNILKELNSEAPINYFAFAQVVKASYIARVNLNDFDLFAFSDLVKKYFPAPLFLYRKIFQKIIEAGADLTNSKKKRWNWIWDIQILFSISSETLGSRKTLLVTSDGDVVNAAIEAGLSDMVMSLSDYLISIDYN